MILSYMEAEGKELILEGKRISLLRDLIRIYRSGICIRNFTWVGLHFRIIFQRP